MYTPQQQRYNSAPLSPSGTPSGYGYMGGPSYTPHRYGHAPGGEQTPLLSSTPAYAVPPAQSYDGYHTHPYNTRKKSTIVCICVAVVLLILVGIAVAAYFVYPRMPTVERIGESDLSLSISPFVLNFTENLEVDNPNYITVTVHKVNIDVSHKSIRVGKATLPKKHTFRSRTNNQPLAVVVTLDNPDPEVIINLTDDCGIHGRLPLHLNGTVDAGVGPVHYPVPVQYDLTLECRS